MQTFLRVALGTLFLLAACDLIRAQEQPPTAPPQQLAMTSPPALPVIEDITDSLVIISCRVDDMTGKRPLPENTYPAPGWRDLELHLNSQLEYECRREIVKPEDGAVYEAAATPDMPEMRPNYANRAACARVGVGLAGDYYTKNPGWAVVGIGCPTPMDLNGDGKVDTFKLPECPTYLPGTANRMRCRFDPTEI